jgi:hypothetical protein
MEDRHRYALCPLTPSLLPCAVLGPYPPCELMTLCMTPTTGTRELGASLVACCLAGWLAGWLPDPSLLAGRQVWLPAVRRRPGLRAWPPAVGCLLVLASELANELYSQPGYVVQGAGRRSFSLSQRAKQSASTFCSLLKTRPGAPACRTPSRLQNGPGVWRNCAKHEASAYPTQRRSPLYLTHVSRALMFSQNARPGQALKQAQ